MYNRVVIKISGEALAKKDSSQLDYNLDTINTMIDDILMCVNEGVDVALTVGGGNIWRGRNSDPDIDRVKADEMGMLATVINGIYISEKIISKGGKSVVMTPFKVGNMTEEYSKKKALEYLKKDYIIIFSGGLGHPYFSTDTIPALRALELEADCVLFAKNVDGVYDKNPDEYDDAVKYSHLTYEEIRHNNLEAIDLEGMSLCEKNNMDSLVFNLEHPQGIYIACKNNDEIYDFGTKITN